MKAIVLDGHLKSALVATRSLGKKGVYVVCASERVSAMSLYSKHCSRHFVYPSPITKKDEFVDAVIELSKNIGGKPLVYAFADESLLPLIQNKEKLNEYATFITPRKESVDIAFDKVKTLSLGSKLDIPCVESFVVDSVGESEVVADALSYPAVVKQISSCIWNNGGGVKGTAEYVFSKDELLKSAKSTFLDTGKWPLIQRFIYGGEFGFEAVCEDGEILASSSHKRIRSINPSGGASVVKETISDATSKQMEDYSVKILRELQWDGPVMIEFKLDKADGVLKLIEINGRFWGSLPLAVFAGVDFPYIYYLLACGNLDIEKTKKVVKRHGVRSRHFLGDVHNLLVVLFGKSRVRDLIYPGRFEAIKDFFTPHTNQYYDVFSLSDIKPFFMEIIDVINKKL